MVISKYHDRMPIILSDKPKQEEWLTQGGTDLLIAYNEKIQVERLPDNLESLYSQ